MEQNEFYLAPLQGFTKVWFRAAFHEALGSIDRYFTPFFEMHRSGGFDPRLLPELEPSLNQGAYLIPQVATNTGSFLSQSYLAFMELGYAECNLNMGCPFPMLVKRQKGGGMLSEPELANQVLSDFYNNHPDARLSVKMRAGLNTHEEGLTMIRLLEKFPLTEIIIHPRLVTQQYKGLPDWDAFEEMAALSRHTLVANGDIQTLDDFAALKGRFPQVSRWMIGRGVLSNPNLIAELKGGDASFEARRSAVLQLHDTLNLLLQNHPELPLVYQLQLLCSFWSYPCQLFADGKRWVRKLSKAKDRMEYLRVLHQWQQKGMEPDTNED